MRATATRIILAACAAVAIGCGQQTASSTTPQTVTPGEAAGTTGSKEEAITVSGCITHVPPDGYALTSIDDAIEHFGGSASHHADNPATPPTQPNRGAENERARSEQNVSAQFGRYRLAGDTRSMAQYVDREVDIAGRVQHGDRENSTPLTLNVETIKPTGAACGARQEQGNDRGALPGQ